jgi:hypothetical protein
MQQILPFIKFDEYTLIRVHRDAAVMGIIRVWAMRRMSERRAKIAVCAILRNSFLDVTPVAYVAPAQTRAGLICVDPPSALLRCNASIWRADQVVDCFK